MPTLYLTVGLPGSGKTTEAKRIEKRHKALRLTPDEWILNMYGSDITRAETDSRRDKIEKHLWDLAKGALRSGLNVVVDFGLWTKKERDDFRSQAEAIGAKVKIVYCETPVDELWRRISSRPESKTGTLAITRAELNEWTEIFEPPDATELK